MPSGLEKAGCGLLLILLAVVAFAVAVLVSPPRCEDVPRIAIGEVMPLGGCDRH
jgi:hypothetical protein